MKALVFTYDNVCTTAIRQLLHSFFEPISIGLEIPGLSTQRLCQVQTRLYRVYCQKMLGFVVLCIYKSTESDGP